MIRAAIVVAAILATAPLASAFAQDQAPAHGHGAFMQACGADIQQYCSSAKTREDRRTCVRANRDKFSQSCQSFLANHMHHHDQGGQEQGGQT